MPAARATHGTPPISAPGLVPIVPEHGHPTSRIADACIDGVSRRKHEQVETESVSRGASPDVEVARYRGGAR